MSNYLYDSTLGDQVTVGHERVNGTGQVYLNADRVRFLTNEEALALAQALVHQAELARARALELAREQVYRAITTGMTGDEG